MIQNDSQLTIKKTHFAFIRKHRKICKKWLCLNKHLY